MHVAVLQAYAKGMRRTNVLAGTETYGKLVVERTSNQRTRTAILTRPFSPDTLHHLLPPLHEPALTHLGNDRLTLTGYERDGKTWVLQSWWCRRVTVQEGYVFQRSSPGPSPAVALFEHWLEIVRQDMERRRETQPNLWHFEVADAIDLLRIEASEFWPFNEWITATGRGNTVYGGRGELGIVEIRRWGPQLHTYSQFGEIRNGTVVQAS